MTPQTWKVVELFLRDPVDRYGLELARAAGLKTGTVYPILDRLADAGLLTVRKETVNASNERRPTRRMFTLTTEGRSWSLANQPRPSEIHASGLTGGLAGA